MLLQFNGTHGSGSAALQRNLDALLYFALTATLNNAFL